MNFYDALKIEGTETYQVLTYFYGSIATMDAVLVSIRELFDSVNCKVYQLNDTDWAVGVVLVEAVFSEPDQAVLAVVESSLSATEINGVIGSMCMFDGGFCGCDEVFLPLCAEQIYSVWVRRGELNLAMNDALRASNEWKKVIADFRRTLGF